MIETFKSVEFEDDTLYAMFKGALKEEKPAIKEGRCFTGTVPNPDKSGTTLITKHSSRPSEWNRLWEGLGCPTPPVALPEGCRFEFLHLGKGGQDVEISLDKAVTKSSMLELSWNCAISDIASEDGQARAAYAVMIVPDKDVLSCFSYS